MNFPEYERKQCERLRKLAPECMVLLKKNGDFPLDAPCHIAVYGSGARQTIKGGTGSGDVNSRRYVTVEQGLKRAGFKVTTKSWLDSYDVIKADTHRAFVEKIKQQAKEQHVMAIMLGMGAVIPEPEYQLSIEGRGDACVYVLGRQAGEGSDRKAESGDLKLTETEIRDIHECMKLYHRFMLVLNVGSIVDLTPVMDVPNILLMSQLGAITGDALADVLLGKSYPSGKLTDTWAAWDQYLNEGEFGHKNDTAYKEGIYVGYRFFDSADREALFPFGYGLGFTEFELDTDAGSFTKVGDSFAVKVPVTNVGQRPGKEVVQLYVTAPWGRLDQPYQKLLAFEKTPELAAGTSADVTLIFSPEDLASYDEEKAAYVIEAGTYILRAGISSRGTGVIGLIEAAEDITVRKLENIGGKPDLKVWKPDHSWTDEEIPEDVTSLELDASFTERMEIPAPYKPSEEAVEFAHNLTDRELINAVIGAHKSGLTSVIGNASRSVPGAAGQSFGDIAGLPEAVMADGPAGLRLSKDYYEDKKGKHSLSDTMPAGFEDYMPPILLKLSALGQKKNPKGGIKHQYCTAIPIGTALAQSWNPDVLEACGDIVGTEMEMFNVDYWLAPGMNIHRSPLCGRNFEYYSEDPLLTGLCAAAITKGVQKHKGKSVTIKHFCANSQETNRYQSNSVIDERTLREIYLKGFEICIRLAQPKALMTSYNLLNGVHTTERADLLKGVLRKEWGYSGLIMTDWVVANLNDKTCTHRIIDPVETLKAGTNIFMPGADGNVKELASALRGKNKEHSITREELEESAAGLVDSIWNLL
ncbi:MAG: glycoside hydrolase family 3 N-terminal domain-containing protein [Eubacterium sp.]|nr:glycoside hydrolase family 3 N-terminal domain-containing protein [Eubacterium sp.]